LLDIMGEHPGLLGPRKASEFIILRDIRGKLFRKPNNAPAEIVADGREAWIGWFELKTEQVNEKATENTARVIGLLDADVLCVVEAEDRIGLKRFNDIVLPQVGVAPYEHVMLIDGNDERGIDVAIMCRSGFEVERMRSHVDDDDASGIVFSRDCPEYEIRTADGNRLLVMVNHFKSKIGGGADKRTRQARKVREFYDARLAQGHEFIAIAGDLNEAPGEASMDALIRNASTLTDIMVHSKFAGDGRPGTHGNGTSSSKLDYILMSPALAGKVSSGHIERRGVWGGTHGTLFPHLPQITREEESASDHAALVAELSL
jgi:endonuclease/exonuclease/phosphatase family metal-dependent hydrolase